MGISAQYSAALNLGQFPALIPRFRLASFDEVEERRPSKYQRLVLVLYLYFQAVDPVILIWVGWPGSPPSWTECPVSFVFRFRNIGSLLLCDGDLVMKTQYSFSLLCDCKSAIRKRQGKGLYESGFPGPSERSS
jgi:hypothetical protein